MEDKLQLFYNSLTANPNIKGLPGDYELFRTTLADPGKSELFYNSLKANRNIKGLPESYDEFVTGLALNSGGITPKEPEQEKPGFLEGLNKKFASSIYGAAEAITEAPQFGEAVKKFGMQTLANAYINRLVKKGKITAEQGEAEKKKIDIYLPTIDFVGVASAPYLAKQKSLGAKMADSKANKWLSETSDRLSKEGTRYDERVVDYLKKGQIGKALGAEVYSITESLAPTLLAALGGPVGAGALGVMTGAETYDEVKDREDMQEAAKVIDGLSTGVFEALFEYLGTAEMTKMLKNAYARGTKEQVEEALKGTVGGLLSKAYKRFGVWLAPVHEGLSEGLTTLGQNATAKFTGEDPERKLNDNFIESVLIGMGMGGVFAGTEKGLETLAKKFKGTPVDQGPAAIGELKVPYTQEQAAEIINNIGRDLKFGDTPLEEDPSPMISFAQTMIGQKVILKKEGGIKGDDFFIAFDLETNEPVLVKAKDIKERKDVPYQEWFNNELQNYNIVKSQADNMAAQMEAPVQPGQEITLKDKNFYVSEVTPEGIVLNEIDEEGNISGAALQITPDQYNTVFGTGEGIQETENLPENELPSATGEGIQAAPEAPGARTLTVGKTNYSVVPDEMGILTIDQVFTDEAVAKNVVKALEKGYPKASFSLQKTEFEDFLTPDEYRITVQPKKAKAEPAKPEGKAEKPAEPEKVEPVKVVGKNEKGEEIRVGDEIGYQWRDGFITKPGKVIGVEHDPGSNVTWVKTDGPEGENKLNISVAQVVKPEEPAEVIDEKKEEAPSTPDETAPEEVKQKAGEVEKPAGRFAPVEKVLDMTGQNMVNEWEEHASPIDQKVTEDDKKIAELTKQKRATRKRDEKAKIDQQIQDIRRETDQLYNDLENEFFERNESIKQWGIAEAKKKGIEIDPNDENDDAFFGDLMTDIFERPGREHTWEMKFKDVFDENFNYWVNNKMFTQLKEKEAAADLTKANKEVDTHPTEAQKKAGNYKKGHLLVQGFDISIENPAGSVRSGTDKSGKKWSVKLNNSYGYFRRTKGKDGDQIDVFLGDNLDSESVYVIDQVDPETGLFDEHKVMLGFNSAESARENYLANYEPVWKGLGSISKMSIDQFKEWLGDGTRTRKPVDNNIPVKKAEKTQESKIPAYGESNKIFTQDAAEKAREILKRKLGQLNVGLDPELMQAGLTLAGYHIEAGARKFADYAKKMIEDLGVSIKPYLKSFYNAVAYYPEFDTTGMDSISEVDKIDVDEIHSQMFKKPEQKEEATPAKYNIEIISEKAFVVKGDTRPIKDQLKALRGMWNPKHKAWMFKIDRLEEIKAAVESMEIQLETEEKQPEFAGEVIEKERTQDEIRIASKLGKEAFEAGKERVPAQDPRMNNLLKGFQVGEAGPVLKAWLDAWDKANVAKNVTPFFREIDVTPIQKKGGNEINPLAQFKEALLKLPQGIKGKASYEAIKKAIPILDTLKIGDWYRSGKMGDTIMPFSIEVQHLNAYHRIYEDPEAYMLIMEHNYMQEGDLMTDPRIDVAVYPTLGVIVPLNYEMNGMDIYREYVVDGKVVDQKGLYETHGFIQSTWMPNLVAQGRTITEADNQKNKDNEQREISTKTIESQAEALESKAENVTDRESAGRILEEADRQIEEIDSQLKLIGEYKIPEDYYKTHEYPQKGLEPILKKEVTKFSKEIARVLGWEHDTDRKGKPVYGHINIPPAGGEGTFILWKPGSDYGVYVNIPFRPTEEYAGDYTEKWAVQSIIGKGQEIMWRLTTKKNKYSGLTNHFVSKDITAGELSVLIKREADAYAKSENKSKFEIPQLDYENRNQSLANTSGESSPELAGGISSGQTGGTLQPREVEGVSRNAGRESRGSGQSVDTGRETEAVGRGRSDRDITGTTEGERPTGLAEGDAAQDIGDQEKPDDLAALNHVILPDDIIVPRGEIAKIRANIAAIELVTKLEKENRNATPEEKQILSKYTGWGGLSNVLSEDKARWRQYEEEWDKKYGDFYDKLKKLLTDEEFRAAINSTINAHYTSIPIIRQMWDMAQHFGFQGGIALEPAGGIGHFIGAMPESLSRKTNFTAYELDSISGRILTKLYPQAKVNISGYEQSNIPNSTQDLVITNVPFGKTAPYDAKNKDLSKFSLHNYFIAKGIRQLKPGGVGIFISSSSTMDNAASTKFREWAINDGNADFIGAIRLPNNAFKENAGTEVTTDILVFRKRDGDLPSEYAQDFRITKPIGEAKTREGEVVPIEVNEYFVDHPENILGKMMLAHEAGSGGLYTGNSQTAAPIKDMDLISAISERIAAMPSGIMNTEASSAPIRREKAEAGQKDGTLVSKDGKIYEVSEGDLIPVEWNDNVISIGGKKHKATRIAEDYIEIKNSVNELLDLEQSESSTDKEIEAARKKLNTLYDAFVKSYRTINKNRSLSFLEDDSEFNIVLGLEDLEVEMRPDKNGRLYRKYLVVKSPIFSKRVSYPVIEPTEAKNIEDAYNISLSYRTKLDLDYIAGLLNTSPDKVANELIKEGFAYKNPATGLVEDKDSYLSGYVKTKYKEAVEAAKDNPEFSRNVEDLQKVLPKDIPGQLLSFRLGSSWIPEDIIQKFITETTDVEDVNVKWVPGVEKWGVSYPKYGSRYAKNQTSGAGGLTGIDLIEHALHLSRPRVTVKEYIGDGKYSLRTDPEATAAAIGKMEEHMDNFIEFVRSNPEYVTRLEVIYNENYNNFIEKKYSLPTFDNYPGANKDITLYEHQRRAVTRILKDSTLLAHQVGTGKTFTMITAAMEMRRLGIAKKPMIVVQNATIEQFAKSFKMLYPSAKILVPEKSDSDKPERRQKIFNRIAYGDWDAVLIPQSFLNFIPDDPAREKAYIEERIAELEEIKEIALEDGGAYNNPVASEAEAAIKALVKGWEEKQRKRSEKKVKDVAKKNLAVTKKIQQQLGRRRDDVRVFEKMGVDALFVDEAHAYKKLGFATAMSNVRGIDTKSSQRALSLRLKIRAIQEKMNGRNVVLATGTPISNTMAEVWTMMNYVSPQVLKEYHIETFDKFASTYGKIEPSLEFTAAGKFKAVDRFKSYQNAPELMLAFRSNADIVLTEDVPEFKIGNTVPKLKDNQYTKVILKQTPGLTSMMAQFKAIMEQWEALTGKEKRAQRHIPLVVFGRAKQAAIDLRLLSPSFPDDPGSKTNAVIKEAKRIYDATSKYNGTQLIFSDMYQSPERPNEVRFNLYDEIKRKLIEQGIPANEIEILKDQEGNKREAIFEKVNNGEIRILMGSTEKLGTGVNVQYLLAGLHHVDAPPRPMDFEQRNGRILRQGNTHASMNLPVEIVTYGVEKTLDATAYQRLAIKQKFINQMMKGEGLDREMADAAEEELPTDMTFDHMMATLSGSQTAILYTFKVGELRKLVTAKQSYERNLIEAKSNLQNEKNLLRMSKDRLVDAEKAETLLNEHFKYGEITSLIIKHKGKSINISKQAKEAFEKNSIENLKKLITEKKLTIDLLNPYLDEVKKGTLAVQVAPDQWEDFRSQRARENGLEILVNGKFGGFIRFNPRSLIDQHSSQYIYEIEVMPEMFRTISSGFTAAPGFFNSVEAQVKKMIDELVPREKANIETHEKAIPVYEQALQKKFDKQEKLESVQKEVLDLEKKMQEETKESTGKSESGEALPSASLDDIEMEGDTPEEPGPEAKFRIMDTLKTIRQKPRGTDLLNDIVGTTDWSVWENDINNKIKLLSQALNTPIAVVKNRAELPQRIQRQALRQGITSRKHMAGVYDPQTDTVYILLDDIRAAGTIRGIEEVTKTVLHEVVAHQGLPSLLGEEEYNKFLDDLFWDIPQIDRSFLMEQYNTSNPRTIAEEYLGMMAEQNINPTLFQKVLAKIRQLLRKLFKVNYTENDIHDMLRRSRENLQKPRASDYTSAQEYLEATDSYEKARFRIAQAYKKNIVDQAAEVYKEKEAKRSIEETKQGIREYIQDLNLPIRKFEEEVLKRGGKQGNDSKPYRDTSLSFGRHEKLYNDFFDQKMKPVLSAVANIKKTGIPGENVLPYIICKHAVERNRVFREKELAEFIENNPEAGPEEINDFEMSIRNKDYSGVMPFDREGKYTSPDDLAKDIVKEFEAQVINKKLIDDLWEKLRESNTEVLNTWEAGQQISADQKKEYLDKFKYFVPLRGWREGAAKELKYTRGQGFSNSLRHAEGRKSLADNPLAYILNVEFQAIAEQVTNEVNNSMLNLIIRNLGNNEIHELATLKKLYYLKVNLPDGSYEWEPTLTRPSAEQFARDEARTKIFREHERLRAPSQAREHEVIVKKPGGDMVMIFKGKNLPVAQALNKQNYMYRPLLAMFGDDTRKGFHGGLATIASLNNMLKAAYTSWNVVFPFTNFMRDFQEASITQAIKQGTGLRVIRNYKHTFPAIIRYIAGKQNLSNSIDQKLDEFYKTGGATGYTHLKTPEEIEKDINKEIKRMVRAGTLRGDMVNTAHKLLTGIEYWNRIFEDATRFSVYLASLAAGNTKEDAASDAKEASVNFNRKGKGSKAWDAWFAFFNVAIQSMQKNFSLAKNYTGKFSAVALSFVTVGFLEAMMNAFFDDDDETSYYNINPYMRQNYLVIPNIPALLRGESKGDKYLSIPLPQFWRGFKSMGAIGFDIAAKRMSVKEGVMNALGNFGSALLPVDIGGFWKSGEFSFAPIVPTVIKPITEVFENRNYMGYAIKNEPFTRDQEKILANAGLGKKNVSPAAKFITDMLFRWGGGDSKYKYYYDSYKEKQRKVPGILDINPSTLEHLFKGYTGGTGAVFSDMITTISQGFDTEQDIDYRNAPFVNKFIRKIPEAKWNVISEYYDLRDDSKITSDLSANYFKEGQYEKALEIMGDEYLMKYVETFKHYESALDDAKKDTDFDEVEGNYRGIELMRQCISDIKDLKEQFGRK